MSWVLFFTCIAKLKSKDRVHRYNVLSRHVKDTVALNRAENCYPLTSGICAWNNLESRFPMMQTSAHRFTDYELRPSMQHSPCIRVRTEFSLQYQRSPWRNNFIMSIISQDCNRISMNNSGQKLGFTHFWLRELLQHTEHTDPPQLFYLLFTS